MKKINRKLLLFIILLFFFTPPIFSAQFINLSFDNIPINPQEQMGLLGINYEINPLFSFGGYGAFAGDRGGFFAIGFTSSIKHYLYQNIFVDMGLFFGGGGGASAFPGSGKMLRPHLYLGLDFGEYAILAGAVNNNISEKDLGTTFSVNVNKKISSELFSNNSLYFAPVYSLYIPDNRNMSRDSNLLPGNISLIGIEFNYQWLSEFYLLLGFYGAGSDTVDGYAKVMSGIGYLYPLFYNLYFDTKLLIGMSGGGNINTGGGAIIQPSVGLKYLFDRSLYGYFNLGKIKSFTGNFQATTYTLGFSNSFNLTDFNLNFSNKTYFSKTNIHLLGFSLNKSLSPSLDIISSTYWAWAGDVGAYAEGCFGFVLKKDINNFLNIYNQSEIGIAGGGGMNVGSGFIAETYIGLEYILSKNLKLNSALGYMQALGTGAFTAPISLFSLKYDFQD